MCKYLHSFHSSGLRALSLSASVNPPEFHPVPADAEPSAGRGGHSKFRAKEPSHNWEKQSTSRAGAAVWDLVQNPLKILFREPELGITLLCENWTRRARGITLLPSVGPCVDTWHQCAGAILFLQTDTRSETPSSIPPRGPGITPGLSHMDVWG